MERPGVILHPDTVAGFLANGMKFEVRCAHCTARKWLYVDHLVVTRPDIAQLSIADLLALLRCRLNHGCGGRGAKLINVIQGWADPARIPAPLGLDPRKWISASHDERVAMIRAAR